VSRSRSALVIRAFDAPVQQVTVCIATNSCAVHQTVGARESWAGGRQTGNNPVTSCLTVNRSESQCTTSIPRVRKRSIPFRLTISTTPEPFGESDALWPGRGYIGFNCSSVAQNRLPFVFSIQYWVTWLAGEHRAPTMAPSASALLTRAPTLSEKQSDGLESVGVPGCSSEVNKNVPSPVS
jgi:hypothetical protein